MCGGVITCPYTSCHRSSVTGPDSARSVVVDVVHALQSDCTDECFYMTLVVKCYPAHHVGHPVRTAYYSVHRKHVSATSQCLVTQVL